MEQWNGIGWARGNLGSSLATLPETPVRHSDIKPGGGTNDHWQ